MTYWNEIGDTHVPLYRTDAYQKSKTFRENVNSEGSIGDKLTRSDVIFVGSCDIMSLIPDMSQHWAKLVHKSLHSASPFIALGVTAGGLPTIIRKLYSYISNFGAPKCVYLTIPRFDGYEYVNKSGKCYNASSSTKTVGFALKQGVINEDESNTWLMQLESNAKLRNTYNNLYILEERFAFIETICKLHSIKLKWTFNPSGPSVDVLYNNLNLFDGISDYMKDSFVGLVKVKDYHVDFSIGIQTHTELVNKFIYPDTWNYTSLCNQAEENYLWYTNYKASVGS